MRFQILQSRPDTPFTFQLLGNQDDVLLTSGPYDSQEACTDAIREAINSLPDTLRYDIQNDNVVALRSESGNILARSQPLNSQQEAASTIASIVDAAGEASRYDVTFTRTRRRATSALRSLQRMSDEELIALYNFARQSQSGRPGFELFQHDDEQYYFHFNDDNGRALLYSRGFNASSKRDRRVESVIQNARLEKRYEIQEQEGRYVIILKARNSQEIARSRLFDSRQEAESMMTLMRQRIPTYADQYVKKRRSRSRGASNVYFFDQVSTSNEAGFEKIRNAESKQHYFHFNDDSGRALLYSQGYSAPKSRDNGIRSVIKNGALRDRYEAKEEDGQYYFILRAGNRQEIARSRAFTSADERDRMIAVILAALPAYAASFGVTLDSGVETQTEQFSLEAPDLPIPAAIPVPVGGDGDGRVEADDVEPEQREEDTILAAAGGAAGASVGAGRRRTSEPEPELEPAGVDEDSGGTRLWLWIIPLILLLLLLPFLFRMCGSDLPPEGIAGNNVEEVEPAPPADEEAPVLADAEELETNGSGSTGIEAPPPPEPLGPNGTALGLASGSVEAQIADLLSDPNRELPATFVMDKVRFLAQSHAINEEANAQIDNLAKLLKAYPDALIEFHGHIDGMEDDSPVNLAGNGRRIPLSTIRARCLYVRMLGRDVPEDQLAFEGFGADNPVASNDSPQNRQRNRRLEFVVKLK